MRIFQFLRKFIGSIFILLFFGLLVAAQFVSDDWYLDLNRDPAVVEFLDEVAPYLATDASSDEVRLFERTFSDAFDYVMEDYVDPPDAAALIDAAWSGVDSIPGSNAGIPTSKMTDAAIAAMLDGLSADSDYYDADFMREWNRLWTSDDYVGIGVRVLLRDGFIEVVLVQFDSPAERAGVRARDRIVAVDRVPVLNWSAGDAALRVGGEVGTDVTLTLRRQGRADFDITVRRERLSAGHVHTTLLGPVGYVRLYRAYGDVAEQLTEDLARLRQSQAHGPDGIILDLRGVSGGRMEEVAAIANLFLDEGVLIASEQGGSNRETVRYLADSLDQTAGVPMVVLIDDATGGVVQALAGAMQVNRRALILGAASPGNAYETWYRELPNEAAMWIAARRVRMPDGRSLDAVGIEPDLHILHNADADADAMRHGRNVDADRCPERADRGDAVVDCAVAVLETGGIERFLDRIGGSGSRR